MTPYEVPLPFNVSSLYKFLRKIGFTLEGDNGFKILQKYRSNAAEFFLKIIFEDCKPKLPATDQDYISYTFKKRIHYPYKYRTKRNNGKYRSLSLPHPASMISMAFFLNEYRDTILYFTNRSNFSIRHPHKLARLIIKKDNTFKLNTDREADFQEQYNFEYEFFSSFFTYKKYNNISRFYDSHEFINCERKYPKLLKLDISKCFDSIYTHTISWVTNGYRTSKKHRNSLEFTFGGRFDKIIQSLNDGETNGIVIGPEFSRIFAEIILQEVDVRVERILLKTHHLKHKRDYEILRYVDDYFIFITKDEQAKIIEEVISQELETFKLHLNHDKQTIFDMPFASSNSVAKQEIRDSIKKRNNHKKTESGDGYHESVHFSAQKAILDYKSILSKNNLKHADLANYYLYTLSKNAEKNLLRFQKYVSEVKNNGNDKQIYSVELNLIKYISTCLKIAFYIYSAAPSVSHAVKISRLIVVFSNILNNLDVHKIHKITFQNEVLHEIKNELQNIQQLNEVPLHTMLLIDCASYINQSVNNFSDSEIIILPTETIRKLDAFGILTMLRSYAYFQNSTHQKQSLLERAAEIIRLGDTCDEYETESLVLKLSILTMPSLTIKEVCETIGISKSKYRNIQRSKVNVSLFDWEANCNYFERLQMKLTQSVY